MITKKILQSEKNSDKAIKIKSFVASFFSVLFSLSILLELKKFTSIYVFIFMTIFVFLFLLYNESQKVESLRKVFVGKKSNIITSLLTFCISVALSSIGLYFWINTTIETTNTNNVKQQNEISAISEQYQSKIDSVNNIQLNNPVYNELLKDKKYWSTRSGTKQERIDARKQVVAIENKIDAIVKSFKAQKDNKVASLEKQKQNKIDIINATYNVQTSNMNKNNFLTGIFLILVLITEVVILTLAKEFAKEKSRYDNLRKLPETQSFILYRKIISMLYATRNKGNTVSIKDIQFMPIKGLQWEMVKHLFNLMDSINIIHHTTKNHADKDVYGTLTGTKEDALNKLDRYYNELLNFYA